MTSRRKYDRQFKMDAVALLKSSEKSGAEVARGLGIKPNLLYRWREELTRHKDTVFPGNGNPHDAELARLKKENADIRLERDILKKAVAIFSKTEKKGYNS